MSTMSGIEVTPGMLDSKYILFQRLICLKIYKTYLKNRQNSWHNNCINYTSGTQKMKAMYSFNYMINEKPISFGGLINTLKGGVYLSSLVLDNDSTFIDRMKKESGDRSYPIWLLVNPKYPADIYDIWTLIMYEIQDKVYRKLHARINCRNIFIMNTVSDIGRVPNTSIEAAVAKEIVLLRESVLKHQPKLLITFGTITNEFVRRVFVIRPENGPKYWSTSNLADEFERSIANFDISRTNWIPLIRRVTKNCKNFKDCDDCENYYHDVATKIAERIIENKDSLKIWI